jgi:hypothetical protein
MVRLSPIPIITLNMRVLRFTPPRVFLTLASALILSAAVIWFNFLQLKRLRYCSCGNWTYKAWQISSPSDYQYLSALCHLHSNYLHSYRKFSSGDYALLYNTLSTYVWSCVLPYTSVDSAVACLNAAVQYAMEHAIPRSIINSNSKFPHWYSSSLRYCIRKKNYFTDV